MFGFTKKMAKAAYGFPTKTVDASFTLRLQSLSTADQTLSEDNGKNLTDEELRLKRVVKKAEEGGGLSDDSSEDETSEARSPGGRSPGGRSPGGASSKEGSGNPFADDDEEEEGGGALPSPPTFDEDQAEKVSRLAGQRARQKVSHYNNTSTYTTPPPPLSLSPSPPQG